MITLEQLSGLTARGRLTMCPSPWRFFKCASWLGCWGDRSERYRKIAARDIDF